jgi:hypothetical protein
MVPEIPFDMMFKDVRTFRVSITRANNMYGQNYAVSNKIAAQAAQQLILYNMREYVPWVLRNWSFHLLYPGYGKQLFNFSDPASPPVLNPSYDCRQQLNQVGNMSARDCDQWELTKDGLRYTPRWYLPLPSPWSRLAHEVSEAVQSFLRGHDRHLFKGIVGLLGASLLTLRTTLRGFGMTIGLVLLVDMLVFAGLAGTEPRFTYTTQLLSLIASSLSIMLAIDKVATKS